MARALLLVTLLAPLALVACDAKSEPGTKEPVEATAEPAAEPSPAREDPAATSEQDGPAPEEPDPIPEPRSTAPQLDDEGDDEEGPEGSCYDKCMRAHMMEARSAESIEQDCKNECEDE